MQSRIPFAGLAFIAIGVILLAHNFNFIELPWYHFGHFLSESWPLVLLGLGGVFWMRWFSDRSNISAVFPATVFSVYGALFYYCNLEGWWVMDVYNLWAFFIIAPGLGFLLMYLFGKRESFLLFLGLVISTVGGMFLLDASDLRIFWPIILIVAGLLLIRRSRQKSTNVVVLKEDSAG